MTTDPTVSRPEVDDPRVLALAQARQQLAYENPFNAVCPPWDGLTEQEQHLSLLDARSYLHAALRAGLVSLPPAAPAAVSVPPPAPRADVLREAADHLTREGRAREDATWSDREAELARGWQDAAHELRRLADEATPVAVPSPLANEPGPAVAAPRADDQAALRDRIAKALAGTELKPPFPHCLAAADAVLAVLPEPADRAAALNEGADAVFALDYDAMVGEEGDENLGSMREAWDLGTVHATLLLRRLADEAQQPDPHSCPNCEGIDPDTCLMNPNRPPEQCPRSEGDGYGLQCQKPAGHNLCTFEEEQPPSGPCVAGEQQNETPEAATVHAVPLPGSNGISSCCGRPPCEFVGERVTRDPDKVTCTGPAAGVRQDGVQHRG